MKTSKSIRIIAAALVFAAVSVVSQAFAGTMQVERLNRGLIAVRVGQGYYLSWRLLADEPYNTGFNVYHGTTKLNSSPITGATVYTDANRAQMTTSAYTVRAVVDGAEREASKLAMIINNTDGPNANNNSGETAGYIQINLQRPPTGQHGGAYAPGDGSVGDLDGDGVYEIILKWDPDNQKDNSQDGTTDNVLIDAYKLDGTRLWRIDLGQNIRAGAHYTQFLVYDFDGDGKAEIMMKTAEGTKDGTGAFIKMGPAANATHSAIRRNSAGRILEGPEYLTVFDGQTGKELATDNYWPNRDPVNGWGNDSGGRPEGWGNRADRFNAAVAYVDGERPTAIFQRGYYDRMTFAAWDWRGGQLTRRWTFDSGSSGTTGNAAYRGQGNHQLSVADADGDGKHDIITGAAVIGSDGRGMHRSGMGHGDALHVAHMIKNTKTPQIFMPHENKVDGVTLRQANNGTQLFRKPSGEDVGRGVAAELDPARPGFKFWGASGLGLYDLQGNVVGGVPSSINHVIWWDGNLARELLNGYAISRWSIANNSDTRLLTATGYGAINGTKSNPVLQADIFGDWREEVIFSNGTNAIRIYTTTATTTHRLVTMMHDPTYRVAVAWQNSSYNQPPHPGYYIASDMDFPPPPLNVAVIGGGVVPPPPPCTPGVNCPGDPCPEGQTGTYPNCTTPPPPAWVYRGGGEYIDSLLLFDQANAAAWSVQSDLGIPTAAFGDREHVITAIPTALQGAEWVRSSMVSRTLTASSAHHPDTLIRFRMLKAGRVYVAYETRVATKPSWLAARGFTQVGGMSITVTEAGGALRTFDIYSMDFSQGDMVTMGINSDNGLSTSMIYLVAITDPPSTSVRQRPLPTKNAMSVVRTGGGSFGVHYTVRDGGNVRIDLFDVKGNRVRTLVNSTRSAGAYRESFAAGDLAAGMYLVRLRVGKHTLRERVLVTR